jgi:prolipoprotein diacylglyceryltransferase
MSAEKKADQLDDFLLLTDAQRQVLIIALLRSIRNGIAFWGGFLAVLLVATWR